MTVTATKLCTYMRWHIFHISNFQNLCFLPKQYSCIYVFSIILKTNSDYFPKQQCMSAACLKMTLNLSDIGMTQHMMLLIWNLNILVSTLEEFTYHVPLGRVHVTTFAVGKREILYMIRVGL